MTIGTLLLIFLILFLFTGGPYLYWDRSPVYGGGGLVTAILIILILIVLGVIKVPH